MNKQLFNIINISMLFKSYDTSIWFANTNILMPELIQIWGTNLYEPEQRLYVYNFYIFRLFEKHECCKQIPYLSLKQFDISLYSVRASY